MPRPAHPDVPALIELLDRPDVEALFAAAARGAMSRERLANTRLPHGFTLRETEDLLSAVLRLQATRSPIPDAEGNWYWYSHTHEMQWCLSEIDRHCTDGSYLHQAIEAREGKRFLVRSLVEEAIATSQLDEASISYESARELLQVEKTPANDAERVVVNTHRALAELPRYAGDPVTPELLIALYDQVAAGTSAGPFRGDEVTGTGATPPTRYAQLAALCAVINDDSRVFIEHPAITGMILAWVARYWLPFPRWNGALSRLLFKLHTLRRGYPVLGFLPVSATIAAWHDGTIQPPLVAAPDEETRELVRYGERDLSLSITIHLQLIVRALQDLRAYIESVSSRDEELRSLLQADPALHSRQRSILGRALRNPDATFRIRYHQTTHHVAYSTARADLMELEAKGYLRSRQQGKALVFTAVPDLPGIIAGRPEAAGGSEEEETGTT